MKEFKYDTNRWRDIPCSLIGRMNIVKMTIPPEAIYRFNAVPIKLPMAFFYRTRTKNFTICMETQKTPNSQSNLEKEKRSWRNKAPQLQTILQSYSNQESMVLHKNRNIDQWNRIESPEIDPCIYGHLIYNKKARTYNGEKTASSINGAGKTGQLHVKE